MRLTSIDPGDDEEQAAGRAVEGLARRQATRAQHPLQTVPFRSEAIKGRGGTGQLQSEASPTAALQT